MGDLIIKNIAQLVTMRGPNRLRQGEEMRDVEILENGYVVVKDDKIIAVGTGDVYKNYLENHTAVVDATGLVMTPGLVDSHTHLVHAGSREHELTMKLEGYSYLDILKAGGGILNTVQKTRKASFTELYDKAKKSLDIMLSYGTTTVEAKSGYGLDVDTEVKQLEVAKKLNDTHPVDIVSTFMGAHAYPSDYKDNHEAFIETVIDMMPYIKEHGLAEFCDVFCERDVFSYEESLYLLEKAKEYGFMLKIHADEMDSIGAVDIACMLGCVSADHLVETKEEDFEKLAKYHIVANLLPATSFNLNKGYAKARKMIEAGCGIALSTDYNPGSSPTENIQLVMQLAGLKLKMTPKEILTAVTINGACALNREKEIGSIEVGKKADFVLFDVPNIDYLIYHFGINHVKDVYKNGKLVVHNQRVCYKEE
ncbi:MAG: imidazolonepropionase [Bacilli bacterium]|nr:imidazolonepropionase [Bacilli bacterium]